MKPHGKSLGLHLPPSLYPVSRSPFERQKDGILQLRNCNVFQNMNQTELGQAQAGSVYLVRKCTPKSNARSRSAPRRAASWRSSGSKFAGDRRSRKRKPRPRALDSKGIPRFHFKGSFKGDVGMGPYKGYIRLDVVQRISYEDSCMGPKFPRDLNYGAHGVEGVNLFLVFHQFISSSWSVRSPGKPAVFPDAEDSAPKLFHVRIIAGKESTQPDS